MKVIDQGMRPLTGLAAPYVLTTRLSLSCFGMGAAHAPSICGWLHLCSSPRREWESFGYP
jgi:hypothetical protein